MLPVTLTTNAPDLDCRPTMAEAFAAVGLAASIVTFVDVSSKVLARLRDFHLITQEAPGVFQDIKARLRLMIDIMAWIKKR